MDRAPRDPGRRDGSTTRGTTPSRVRQRGQALVIFAASIVFFVGLLAIVLDVTWYWANTLKVQRAADAAALAGAVWLPDQPSKAVTTALASAKENGYVPGSGVTVTAAQNPSRDIQLDTTVSAPVSTFFMRLFGITTIQATRSSAAEYVLPVPMGSPLNYFGAFGDLRGWIHTDTSRDLPDPSGTGDVWRWATATTLPNGSWQNVSNGLNAPDGQTTRANGTAAQAFGAFHLPMYGSDQRFVADGGIEVRVVAKAMTPGCQLRVDVTSDAGSHWYGGSASPYAIGEGASLPNLPTTLGYYPASGPFGGHASNNQNDTGDWFGRTDWASSYFTDASFRVRLTPVGTGCLVDVDAVGVKVSYEALDPPIVGPDGETLVQQGVWATVNSQGSGSINGDIYSSQGVSGDGSGNNASYSPGSYYDYAVEVEPGTSNAVVYVFDPVFCATSGNGDQGMGDRWYGGSNGMSTFFDIYNTNNTPYDLTDDTWIAGNTGPQGSSNPLYNLFRKVKASDPGQGGGSPSGAVNCTRGKVTDPSQGAYWHNRWWRLAANLPGPTGSVPLVYRIHVTSSDPLAANDQRSTNAENSFSFFATVAGHTCPSAPADPKCPRVYGLGSMEAFSPLDPGTSVDLYMSQISAVYAGKTIKVSLWDPGDTGQLSAVLSFRMPNGSGYQSAPFTWTASGNCNSHSTGSVTSLTTNTGYNNSLFNGCWVVISINIPSSYTAPTPPGEPGPGWWKIRYVMGSQSSSSAFDVTTWKTQIIGNPVHLVVP